MIRTAILSPAEFAATCAKVEAINARAAKKGLAGTLAITGTTERERTYVGGFPLEEVVVHTTITGLAPCYAGWTFAGRIDAVGDSFVLSTTGEATIDRDIIEEGVCEHCNTTRERKVTYVLLGHGRQVQVGSTCIKDFLGWEGAFSLSTVADLTDEDFFGAEHPSPAYSPQSIILIAEALVRVYGFVRTGDGYSTRDRIETFLFGSDEHARNLHAALAPVLAEVQPRAAATMAYIASEEFAGEGDYVANMKALVAAEHVAPRHFGFLASAPAAYARFAERTAARAATATSAHLATVGAKIEVEATVTSIRYIESQYGTSTLYTLTTAEGDVVKWFASRAALGHTEGVAVTVKATVKAHESYAGTAQTVVTRAKAL